MPLLHDILYNWSRRLQERRDGGGKLEHEAMIQNMIVLPSAGVKRGE